MAHSSEKVGQMKARKSMLPCPFTHIPKHSLHQTTIEESFKKAILANFKFSKPTIISDVIYEVDSDEESPDSSNAFTLLPKIEPSSDICKTEESHTDSKQNNMERSPDIFDEITIDFPGIGDPFPSELPQDETQENSSDLTQNQLVLGETSGLSFFKHHFDTNHNVTNVPYNDSSSPATTQPCRRPTGTDFDYESMEGNSNGERGLKRKDAIGSNSSINLISKPTCSPAKQLKASDAIRRDNLHIGQRIPSPNPSSSSSTIPYLVYNEVSSSISSPRLVMFPTCDNEELTTQKLSNSPSLDSASPLPHTSKTTPPPRKAVNSSAVQKACTTTQKLSNSPSLESASPLPHTSKTTPPPRKAVNSSAVQKACTTTQKLSNSPSLDSASPLPHTSKTTPPPRKAVNSSAVQKACTTTQKLSNSPSLDSASPLPHTSKTTPPPRKAVNSSAVQKACTTTQKLSNSPSLESASPLPHTSKTTPPPRKAVNSSAVQKACTTTQKLSNSPSLESASPLPHTSKTTPPPRKAVNSSAVQKACTTTQKLSNSPSLDSASPLPHTSKTTPPPRKAVNSSAVQKACTTTQKLSNSPSLDSASPLPHTSKTTPPPRKAVNSSAVQKACTTTQKLSNSPSLDSASPLPHTSKTTPPPRKAVNSSAVQKACTTTQKLSNSPSLESASPLPHTSKTTPPPRKAVRNFNEVKKLKEEMSKKLQAQKLELFEKLIAMVFRSPVIIEDRTKIADFLHMTDDEKYILMMLFTDKDGWYNIFKFCTEIQFIGDDKYKLEISEKLQEQGFVETDYKQSDLEGLLKSLTKEELKSIINVLYLAPKTKQMSKADCIGTILLGAGNKLNLKNIVLKEVKKTLGFAFKITQSIRDVFDRVHVLATFSNPQFADIRDYFKLYIDEKGVLPDAAVEDYVIFRTKDEFNNYVSALKLEKELKLNGHKPLITLHVAESAVYALTKLSSATEHRNPRHLQQFTPEHVYCSTLSKCCEQLLQKSNKVGKNWLPFLIQKFPRDGKLGRWYCMLVEFYINEKRYKTAAEVLFEALDEKKLFLKEIDFHELGKLGRTLRQSKKYLLVTAYRDRIIKLIPARIDVSKFSRQRIDISKPLKKSYMIDAILKFYSENDYPGSVPHAGPVLKALLVLYFWDIIYNPTETVSASFVSKLQSVPLDMYYSYFLPYFYQNRKKAIDQRIKQIESEWSIQELIEFGKNNYQNHSHEHGAAGVIEKVIALDTLKIVVSILGISVLVNFFKRLIINMAEAECGMPHLLVWNVDRKAYKFIVCSKSDNSLEISQSLWLDFLVKKEVCVEICHVYSSYKKCKRNSRQESDATGEQIPSGPMSADREESSGE